MKLYIEKKALKIAHNSLSLSLSIAVYTVHTYEIHIENQTREKSNDDNLIL